jgi:hypothetical protein
MSSYLFVIVPEKPVQVYSKPLERIGSDSTLGLDDLQDVERVSDIDDSSFEFHQSESDDESESTGSRHQFQRQDSATSVFSLFSMNL